MPRKKLWNTVPLRPISPEEVDARVARMRAIKMAHCERERVTWDDAALSSDELNELGTISCTAITARQREVLDAAAAVANPRGELTVNALMAVLGLDARHPADSSRIRGRIHLMQSHGKFPFKVVTMRKWRP